MHEQTAMCMCTRLQTVFCKLFGVCDFNGGGPGLSLLQRLGLTQDLLRCDLQGRQAGRGREEGTGAAASGGGRGRASGGGGQGGSEGRRRG
jgi:hypothetical protein